VRRQTSHEARQEGAHVGERRRGIGTQPPFRTAGSVVVIKRCRELGFGKVRVALLAMLIWRQIGQRWHSVWEERKGEERSMNEACNVKLKWQSRGREVTSAALESFWRSTFCLFRTARQAEEEAGDEKKKT